MTTPVDGALRQAGHAVTLAYRAAIHITRQGVSMAPPSHTRLVPQQSQASVLDHPQEGDDAGPAARHSGPRDEQHVNGKLPRGDRSEATDI